MPPKAEWWHKNLTSCLLIRSRDDRAKMNIVVGRIHWNLSHPHVVLFTLLFAVKEKEKENCKFGR